MYIVLGISIIANLALFYFLARSNRNQASRERSWQQDFNSISAHLNADPKLRTRMIIALMDFLTKNKVGFSQPYRLNLAGKIIDLLFP